MSLICLCSTNITHWGIKWRAKTEQDCVIASGHQRSPLRAAHTVAVWQRARPLACKLQNTYRLGCFWYAHTCWLFYFKARLLRSVDAGSGLCSRFAGWAPPWFGMRSAPRCWLGLLQCKQDGPRLQRRCLWLKTLRHSVSAGSLVHFKPSTASSWTDRGFFNDFSSAEKRLAWFSSFN